MIFANAKPTPNWIVPDIVGKVVKISQAAEALGVSSDTILRRIKDGQLKACIIGETKDGNPIYITSDWWVRQYFKRLNGRPLSSVPSLADVNPDLVESKIAKLG